MCLQSRAGTDVDPESGATLPFGSPSHVIRSFGAVIYELALGEPPPLFNSKAILIFFNCNSRNDIPHTFDSDSQRPGGLHKPMVGYHGGLFVNLQPNEFQRCWLKAQSNLDQHDEKEVKL